MLKITTDHKWREPIRWYDLTAKEQAEFDYLDSDDRKSDALFARYRGWCYDLGEFMCVPSGSDDMGNWQGYASVTYFSGVVIKWDRSGDSLQIGRYYSCG